MLPSPKSHGVSLADVMGSSLSAVVGESNRLQLNPVDRAVVVLVDGLGAACLRASAGHARHLAAACTTRADVIDTGVPTTTAAAIATLTTGELPGVHGIVAYAAYDAAHDRVVKQLQGLDESLVPEEWQPVPTLFERATARGLDAVVIAAEQHRDSGYTRATLRGARYIGARDADDRFDALRRLLADRTWRGLVYLYVFELDKAAHASGWHSASWLEQLESVDAQIARLSPELGSKTGLLLTADHGMVDVQPQKHVVLGAADPLLVGIKHIAGEPRMWHLHLQEPTQANISAVAAIWRSREGSRAWIATREQAIAAGWFGGSIRDGVADRIGHVLVAARAEIAYATEQQEAEGVGKMIGQHGSWTPAETRVPLLRFGGFAR